MSIYLVKVFYVGRCEGETQAKTYQHKGHATALCSKIMSKGKANYIEIIEVTHMNNVFLFASFGTPDERQWTFEYIDQVKKGAPWK